MVKCDACERGEHWDCGMQTWCECECDGYDEFSSIPKTIQQEQSDDS